ncbi:hypothetical protein BGW36DRAFT_380050 [Talaromyces proteolyticus]|uniref:Alginate lyase 2 domain-containing protein n=1 Tax=Talaromyces proteolyticus TaxID=1131652 RepID=A0AAD4KNX9_9EURO|nr:uncharacterized protein BGW36DRAFT_380050 [Talaromyces proteolyticus]KAH8696001.1 hypothetical protein BGW36DRAFT_380050 [Talaromyces proteolyticus]
MIAKNFLLTTAIATLALAGSPVGSGQWTEVHPEFHLQQCAGGEVSGDSYTLPKSPNGSTSGSGCRNGHLRAERSYENHYTSGVHQFGGEFNITSLTGTHIALKQTHGVNSNFFIMGIKNNGDIYEIHSGRPIASGVAKVGTTVRINTIHDTNKKTYALYINGKLSYTDDNAPSGDAYYDKCGAYAATSGYGTITVNWDDVQFWTQ